MGSAVATLTRKALEEHISHSLCVCVCVCVFVRDFSLVVCLVAIGDCGLLQCLFSGSL